MVVTEVAAAVVGAVEVAVALDAAAELRESRLERGLGCVVLALPLPWGKVDFELDDDGLPAERLPEAAFTCVSPGRCGARAPPKLCRLTLPPAPELLLALLPLLCEPFLSASFFFRPLSMAS